MSWHSLVSPRSRRSSTQNGFGLIEVIVSISIMVIVMVIVLIRQSSFNSAVLLRSQAYEIALQLREVQLSAVSVSNLGAGNNFRDVLGVHFSTAEDGQYRIFRDNDNDNFYTTNEEFGIQGRLDERFQIRTIQQVGGSSVNSLSIIFERPNFDARFYTAANSESTASAIQIIVAKRGGESPGECGTDYRAVEVTSTGQIAVLEC